MANPLSLSNPIFQASQGLLEQSGQAKNMAVQGLINEKMQVASKKMAAQMEAAAQMAQAKDPVLRKMGLQTLIQLGGKEPALDLDQRLDEAAMATADLIKFRQTVKDPDTFRKAWENYLSRFGTDYISEFQMKNIEKSLDPMQQAIPSAVSTKYGLPAETTFEQAKGLGVNLADTGDKDTATASLREFEMVNGVPAGMRGTPQYQKQYQEWMRLKNPGMGAGNLGIVFTNEGPVVVDKRSSTATPVTGPGGGTLGKPLPTGASDELATLDSLQQTIKKVEAGFKPAYVGLADATLGAVTGATDVGADPNEQTFRADVASMRKMLFEEGGKALTANEMKVLEPFIPSVWDGATKFKSKLDTFKAKYQDIMEKKQKAYQQTGYGVPTVGGVKSKLKQKYGLE